MNLRNRYILLWVFLVCQLSQAQISTPLVFIPTACPNPGGVCGTKSYAYLEPGGSVYVCKGGVWIELSTAADLASYIVKGSAFATNKAAVINSVGTIDGATGSASDCVRVDGSSGPCNQFYPANQTLASGGSRSIGPVYHNVGTTPMFVTVSVSLSSSSAVLVSTDSSTTPTHVVCTVGPVAGGGSAVPVSFFVLPGNYYSLTLSGVAATTIQWTEWQ